MKTRLLIFLSILLALNTNAETVQGRAQSQQAPDIEVTEEQPVPLAQRGGDFTLYGVDGAVSLSDFRGKVVAIYFGYSKCPDVCPTNLAILGAAMKQLTETELESFQAIFISVDPARDSPQALAQYTHFFHPEMIGISGAPGDLDPVVAQYGAYYEKVRYGNSEMMYGIDHTSETYLIDREGKLVRILSHASPRDEVLAAIRAELEKN